MQQTADWLQKLGLGQYAQSFAENDIDFAVIADLTDQDLEKIGVSSLGHRRKLLRAIAELKGAPEPSSGVAAPVAPRDIAERRQVTVMFASKSCCFHWGNLANSSGGPRRGPASARTNKDQQQSQPPIEAFPVWVRYGSPRSKPFRCG